MSKFSTNQTSQATELTYVLTIRVPIELLERINALVAKNHNHSGRRIRGSRNSLLLTMLRAGLIVAEENRIAQSAMRHMRDTDGPAVG